MPVEKATKTHTSFLVGGIPRKHLDAVKELAESKNMTQKELILGIFEDIYNGVQEEGLSISPKLLATISSPEKIIPRLLAKMGFTTKKQQITALQKVTLKLLEE